MNQNKKKRANQPNLKKQSEQKSSALYYMLFILVIVLIAYYPSLNNQFTNWDDGGYIVDNLDLKHSFPEEIKLQFSQYCMGNYHPLTMISLAIDYAIGKLNPKPYHITNLICHLINTLLVFRLLVLLLSWKKGIANKTVLAAATIGSVLFGVHTLSVESVAWVSERKNLLYVMFFLSSLILYIKYIKENKISYYILSVVLFILSLLSKGAAVSLALTLILTDYYYDRKLLSRKVILEKIPFFMLSLIFGVIAVHAQQSSHSIQTNEDYFLYERFLFGGYGLFQYVIKLILPLALSFFYNYPPRINGLLPSVFYLYPFLSLLLFAFIIFYFRKSKIIMFGVLFFLVNIVLVLQIIPVGFAVMADRYTYLPFIGFALVLAVIYQHIAEQKPTYIKLYIGFIVVYSITLIYLTQQQCKAWHDGLTLWDKEIENYPGSALAFKSRGSLKLDNNDNEGAYKDFDKAIQLNPKYGEAYNGRGMAKGKMQDYKGAIEDLDKAVVFGPRDNLAWNNRGIAKSILNDPVGAIPDFNKAIELDPKFYTAYYNRGLAETAKNDTAAAMADFTMTIKLNPDYTTAYFHRGLGKLVEKDFTGAISDFDITLQTEKDNSEAYFNRGIAKYNLNDKTGSCEDWKTSLSLGYAKAEEQINVLCK